MCRSLETALTLVWQQPAWPGQHQEQCYLWHRGITRAYYWPSGWSWILCLLSILSSSAGVDVDDVSCKYWVITIRINLPKNKPIRVSFSGI